MALGQDIKAATLCRMVMPDHLCPYGLKSKDLLERQGYTVEDHHLETHGQTEEFKKQRGVSTPNVYRRSADRCCVDANVIHSSRRLAVRHPAIEL